MLSFFISSLGCKVNQEEAESIADCLKDLKLSEVRKAENADIIILNTCTVTANASKNSKHQARQLGLKNPEALFIVTGCSAQLEADELASIEGVNHVISHSDKHKIPEMLKTFLEEKRFPYPLFHKEGFCMEENFQNIKIGKDKLKQRRARAFLKIQDGCDAFCSYCIVPYTRGRSRSLKPELVLEKVKKLSEAGYKEIVLTGIHIGKYGLDLEDKKDISKLILALLEYKDCPRLRLGSLEPLELKDDLLDIARSDKRLVPHFHIPMQSGSDSILKAMKRPYNAAYYAECIEKIHKALPYAAIGADILTGFPGESEKDFEESLKLASRLPLNYLHVFPYSPRKGTEAASFPDQIRPEISKKRADILRKKAKEKQNAFLKTLTGRNLELVFELKRDKKTKKLKGLSENYQSVMIDGPDKLLGDKAEVRINSIEEDGRAYGELI